MKRNRRSLHIVLYTILIIFASCEFGTISETTELSELPENDKIEIEQEVIRDNETIEAEEQPIIEEQVIETENQIIIKEEETITMELRPITEYDHYFTTDDMRIYGIDADGIHPIEIEAVDSEPIKPYMFAIVDGKILIIVTEKIDDETSVMTSFYQHDGKIEFTTESPLIRPAEQVEIESSPFKIVSSKYNDMDISCVYNGTLQVNYLPVDGACVIDGNLLYHVSETLSIRESGLYLWEPDCNSPTRIMEHGRLW